MTATTIELPLCEAEITSVAPVDAGLSGPALALRMRLQFDGACGVVGIRGELGVLGPDGLYHRFAALEPTELYVPEEIKEPGGRHWWFRALVDARTLDRVNAIRGENAIVLQASMWFAVRLDDGVRIRHALVDRRIASSDWIDLLSKLGVRDALLLEIPLPPLSSGQGHLARAVDFLRLARNEMLARNWKDAVAQVRHALDATKDWREDERAIAEIGGQVGHFRERSLEQRLQFVRFAVEKLADGAAHGSGVSAELPWDLPTTRAVFAMACAVISAYVGAIE